MKARGAIITLTTGLAVALLSVACQADETAPVALDEPTETLAAPETAATATPGPAVADAPPPAAAEPATPTATAEPSPRTAGDRCAVALGSAASPQVTWVVPEGMTSWDCRGIEAVRAEPCECVTPLRFVVDRALLFEELDRLSHRETLWAPTRIVDASYSPVAGRRAWIVDRFADTYGSLPNGAERRLIIDVGDGIVTLVAYSDPNITADWDATLTAFAAITESLEIDVPLADGADGYLLPVAGGVCRGRDWAFDVPTDWFGAPSCRSLNTSSESDVALQCECRAPIWTELTSAPIESAVTLVDVTQDASFTRADGITVRTVEGTWIGDLDGPRLVRLAALDMGDLRLMIYANRELNHAGPGHVWADTIEGFLTVVGSVRAREDAVADPAPVGGVPFDQRTLAGRHGLTLQWISWEPDEWGAVDFEIVGPEQYAVSGRQDGPEGMFVSVGGVIHKLTPTELYFDGTVEIGANSVDRPTCVRNGPMIFLSTQDRRYWRMQDFLNCDTVVTDYVDIYFG